MPYVKEKVRKELDAGGAALKPGELTYKFQRDIQRYLDSRGGVNYQVCTEIIGALEGMKADFIRRVLDPYEEQKQKENGDVWAVEPPPGELLHPAPADQHHMGD